MSKRPGSSLLLVSMIIAGIVTIIISTQRIALIQFSQSISEEDNLLAMYAAKAGIEDGLMRFRYNRNVEIDDFQRIHLAQGTFTDEGVEAGARDPDIRPDEQYYEINITFKTDRIDNRRISRDETVHLSGFSNQTDFRYSLHFDPGCSGWRYVQFFRIDRNGQVLIDQVETNNVSREIRLMSGESLRIKLIAQSPECKVNFSATSNRNFDGLSSFITSTGYFGAAKRTFVAEADRLTGTIIGIHEFTAFTGREIRTR